MTKNLKGSWSRDSYLYWRKWVLPGYCIGGDVDFVFLCYDTGGILGLLDFKQIGDTLTKTERKIYSQFLLKGLRVFIAVGDLEPLRNLWALDEIGWPIPENVKLAKEIFNSMRVWEYFGEAKTPVYKAGNFIDFEKSLRQGKI